MRQKSRPVRMPAEQVVKDIRRATRRHFSAEDKIRIVLDGLRGEDKWACACPVVTGPKSAHGKPGGPQVPPGPPDRLTLPGQCLTKFENGWLAVPERR